jgi:hypothetical protein
MNILVLGASGGCGQWVCRLAADRGHNVKAVVRAGSYVQHLPNVVVVQADVLDQSVWPWLLQELYAVISALGIKRKNPGNPFSKLASPEGLTTKVVDFVVQNAPPSLKKIAVISAAGVGNSYSATAGLIRWMISNSNMKSSYDDLESMEGVLSNSGLNWLAVRPTTLYDGGPTDRCKEVSEYCLTSRDPRGDVAQWMIHFVESGSPPASRTPIIAQSRQTRSSPHNKRINRRRRRAVDFPGCLY